MDNEHTYPSLLEAMLAERFPDKKVEAINAGVFLYDIVDELDYYREKGRHLQADYVVLQFYINDLEGMTRWFFRPHNNAKRPYSSALAMLKQSALFNAAAALHYMIFKDSFFIASLAGAATTEYQQYLVAGTAKDVGLVFDQKSLLDEGNYGRAQKYWDRYLEILATFRKEVEGDGTRFLFVMIPDQTQVADFKNGSNRALAGPLNSQGICSVDMLPVFRALARDGLECYNSPHDFHLNPGTLRVIGYP